MHPCMLTTVGKPFNISVNDCVLCLEMEVVKAFSDVGGHSEPSERREGGVVSEVGLQGPIAHERIDEAEARTIVAVA